MRLHLLAIPLSLLATPALAAPPAAQTAEDLSIPPQLGDPQLANRLVDAMKILSRSFLDLPVGEVQAALEGRPATGAERGRTIGSETGLTERQLKHEIEKGRPMILAGQKALVAALPAVMKGLNDAQKELERAAANLPRPDYPKR